MCFCLFIIVCLIKMILLVQQTHRWSMIIVNITFSPACIFLSDTTTKRYNYFLKTRDPTKPVHVDRDGKSYLFVFVLEVLDLY